MGCCITLDIKLFIDPESSIIDFKAGEHRKCFHNDDRVGNEVEDDGRNKDIAFFGFDRS